MKNFIANQNVAFAASPFTTIGKTIAYGIVAGSKTDALPQGEINYVQVRFADMTTRWLAASTLIRVF